MPSVKNLTASAQGASASAYPHETGFPKFNHKHSHSETLQARADIVAYFAELYPHISLKIKDSGVFFIARAKNGPRRIRARAYSLERMFNYLTLQYQIKVY